MEKLLILGGSQFIGRHLVETLLTGPGRGRFDITLFNRQRTNADLFPDLRKIKGDRETDEIARIGSEDWDYVIDLSSYYPDSLADLFAQLGPRLKKYVYISTISVYDMQTDPTGDRAEDGLQLTCTKEERTDSSSSTYGKRKVACEAMIVKSGIPHVILRPAIVYGTYDYTDRFYYWLYQVKRKDRVLVPERGERTISLTYVGDLALAMIRALDLDAPETVFNAISQPVITIGETVRSAMALMDREVELVDAPGDFLKTHDIRQMADLPLWISADHYTFSNARMTGTLGLSPSSFRENVAAMIAHYDTHGWHEPVAGMDDEKRLRLIRELQATS